MSEIKACPLIKACPFCGEIVKECNDVTAPVVGEREVGKLEAEQRKK